MKKILKWGFVLPLLAMMFSVAMVSCGDDDDKKDEAGNYSKLIIGTWSDTGEWDGNYHDQYNTGYIFRADGSMTEFSSGRLDGSYRISGNKLITLQDYGEDECVIHTLTDNKLVLGWSDYEIETLYRVTDR